MTAETYGRRVKAERRRRLLTLRQLAARTGVSIGHLSDIERDATMPSIAVAQQLADALDINPIVTADYAGAYGDGERAGFLAGYRAAAGRLAWALAAAEPWAIPSPDEALADWLAVREGGDDHAAPP